MKHLCIRDAPACLSIVYVDICMTNQKFCKTFFSLYLCFLSILLVIFIELHNFAFNSTSLMQSCSVLLNNLKIKFHPTYSIIL